MSFKDYTQHFQNLINTVEEAEVCRLGDAICDAYRTGRTVFMVGNGGSGANASHLCEDLGKGTLSRISTNKNACALSASRTTPPTFSPGATTRVSTASSSSN